MLCISVSSFDDIKWSGKIFILLTETIERVKRTAKEMGYEYRGKSQKEKDRDERYDYDHVSFSSNTVLYNIDSVYYAGSAGTWVVYAD